MEHDRPSSIFLDLPPTSQVVDGSHDADLVLPNISRMLMEDSIVDKFLCKYPDHPAVVEAQQLFTQIISDASPDALAVAAQPRNSIELPSVESSEPAPSTVESLGQGNNTDAAKSNSSRPAEGSSCCMDVVSMAFFKGMEEASKFLPTAGGGRGQKKRLDAVDEDDEPEAGMGRSCKQMAADGDELAEAAAREMLDQLMLNGDEDEPSVADMQELRRAMEKTQTPQPVRPGASAGQQTVDLHFMLILCAEAVANDDRHGVAELLERIRSHSSPTGDGTQRLAHYFAGGLEARLAGTGARSVIVKRASLAGYLKYRRLFMAVCCFLPVSFLFSNKTIYNAVAGRNKLHIVDYGLRLGLQWPELLRWLARREGGPPAVRLTGIDVPKPGFRPAQLIEETGRRLSDCARQLGVPFRFRGIAAKSEVVRADDLDIDPDEVLVVNSIFHFGSLMDESVTVDGEDTSTMDIVLNAIREMRPSVFIHAIVNASYNTVFFATRFREALYNFTALFDMMETILPRDSDERLLFERDVLGQCAMNVIACEGVDRVQRPRSYRQWQSRSQWAGLRQLPLDHGIVQMLKDKVKEEYHKCFEINEDQQWLIQGWKGRVLYALSTWTAGDDLA